jgi:2-dehydropantoate 2-reductase
VSAPPVLIVGTGALGTLFAARLAAAGTPVTMLGGWPEGLRALRANGVRLTGADGVTRHYPVHVAEHPAECAGAPLALVLVKAWQTEHAGRQLSECLREDGLAVTLQNGLGNLEILAHHLGSQRTALGVTTTGATLLSPGLARAGGEGVVSIEDHPRLSPLAEALRVASFNVEVVSDARALAWGKLVINAAINPLTALLRVPNGELLERPEARALMGTLAREAAAVAAAQGVTLHFDDPVQAAEDVARRTAANHSSMFQDIQRGAPTEIDAICGAVCEYGERSGVATPVNWSMWQLVRASIGQGEAVGAIL